jgi:hypothetical protein
VALLFLLFLLVVVAQITVCLRGWVGKGITVLRLNLVSGGGEFSCYPYNFKKKNTTPMIDARGNLNKARIDSLTFDTDPSPTVVVTRGVQFKNPANKAANRMRTIISSRNSQDLAVMLFLNPVEAKVVTSVSPGEFRNAYR